ncbi:MAG: DNA (cytosine-5-)-methyltransferase, partial [Candidatus Methanomethylophilaceae archaeon]|nr:DNA (cytosine-5-)-methyltransferase [Candidatus Methanomethylophilaceae archaeon]
MAHGHGDVLYPVAAVQEPLAERPAPGPQLEADPELLLHTGLHPAEALLGVELVGVVQRREHDLLVGGFTCQDYSVAATKAKGIEGKKGVLWWSIHDIIKSRHPRFILLENVDRLIRSPASQRGRDFGIILRCLADEGYDVEWRIVNAAEYGLQQRRRRTFIFAVRKDQKFHETYNNELEEVIKDKGFFARTFPITPDIRSSKVNRFSISEKKYP